MSGVKEERSISLLLRLDLEFLESTPKTLINSLHATARNFDTPSYWTLTKERLGEHLEVDSRSVHAFIVGEHGDSEIAAWLSANVSGIPLHDFCEMRGHHDHEGATSEIAEKVKNSVYEIIQRKGATYYGIAMSVKRICEAIIRDERSILPISTMMDGEYGIKDVVLSMPSIVGAEGFISKVPISLSEDEIKALHKSAETLKSVLEEALE